ncbi:MAG TPA: aminotransferase class I/II-fold pyridoxal phosphate-dependent enzyme [Euzebyales bacterium]
MTVRSQYRITGSTRSGIVASVETGVEDGALRPGDDLPPVRALASQLAVSPATVAAAYRDLRARGVTFNRPRRGVQIAHRPPLVAPPATDVPDGVVDLAQGNPDPALLPPLPALVRRGRPRLYGDPSAVPALLDAVGDELEADDVATGHVAVTSGALDGIDRILDVHLRPGDRIAVEDPCWTGTRDLIRVRGLDAVGVAVDDRGMSPDRLAAALREGVAAVLVTPRAHNPRGAAFDADRAAELRTVLAAHPVVLVIEDDHAGIVAGAAYHTLTGGRDRWAVVRSMAKSLGPDLRLAVLAGDRHTVARVEGRQRLGPGWVSTILQRLAAHLLTDPNVADLLDRAAATYTRRRDALVAALGAVGLDASGRSGLNVWVPVPEEGAVVAGMQRAGWAVRAGEPFRLSADPAIRITAASLDPADAGRVAADLATLLAPSATRPA